MYSACNAVALAEELFESYESKDVCTWTALMAACTEAGRGTDSLNYFERMQQKGVPLDASSCTCALKACASIGAIDTGEHLHSMIIYYDFLGGNIVLGTALVNMYAKCKVLNKARQVLEGLPTRNTVCWNALIVGYVQQGLGGQALKCFEEMQGEGINPDTVTFTITLKACACIGLIAKGKQIHVEILKQDLLGSDVSLGTALVDMYIKCKMLQRAQLVLEELPTQNLNSWNALISAYVRLGCGDQALDCFGGMLSWGFIPDEITYLSVLKAAGIIEAGSIGEQLHNQILEHDLLGENTLLGTALVDMYAKCGYLMKARHVLSDLLVRDTISWNALIAGYTHNEEGTQALECFEMMQQEGLSPNAVTFMCILKACGSVGAVRKGERLHEEMAKQGLLEGNTMLCAALVDMYAKCGALDKAGNVLKRLHMQSIFAWNALLRGYVQHGEAEQVIACLKWFHQEGAVPDEVTFTCMLSACSRLGLMETAKKYLSDMNSNYGMRPHIKQLTCLVDLLGRVGQLDKAFSVVEKSPSMESELWCSLLGTCQKSGNVKFGRYIFDRMVQINKRNAAAYVRMSQIYAAAGMV
ncbi:hypothetical protein KP509_05G035800 [Ceratopteris richardii]|nr:hypothetical protein KP509_05G035800 [Ceratopteris richardii]